jgi:hypothetical protein
MNWGFIFISKEKDYGFIVKDKILTIGTRFLSFSATRRPTVNNSLGPACYSILRYPFRGFSKNKIINNWLPVF